MRRANLLGMLAFVSLTIPAIGAAQPPQSSASAPADAGTPITIGRSYALRSQVLGDTRRLNVWLPPSYGQGDKSYPVLYLLDGGVDEDFLHIVGLQQIVSAYGKGQELIVVGIEGVARRHDLSPPTSDPADLRFTKDPGGAGAYRRFLADEVRPWVAGRFRTNGRSALMGESIAGLFVLDTLVATPAAFTEYISVSPALFWDRGALSRKIAATAAGDTGPDRRLFVVFEGGMAPGPGGLTTAQQAEQRVEDALRGRPNATTVRLADEHHDTIYHPAALLAFRALYSVAASR